VPSPFDQIDLIGVPFNSAGTNDGVARAPTALRHAGLVDALTRVGLAVRDSGDLDLPPPVAERDPDAHVLALAALPAMIERVRSAVAESLERGAFPLVLGGDCPVLLGCLGAMAAGGGAPRVLFVDGHEDAWPPAESTTGEAADMEFGWLVSKHSVGLPDELRRAIPVVRPDDAIIFGARDEDELADAGVESLERVVRIVRPDAIMRDPDAVAHEAAIALGRRGPWWFHVDLDVLGTDSLRAVDYPQAGGLDWTTLTSLTRRALLSPNVIGWDVTIYNPDLDPVAADAKRIVRYVTEVLTPSRRPGTEGDGADTRM
jgi:arginase